MMIWAWVLFGVAILFYVTMTLIEKGREAKARKNSKRVENHDSTTDS